MSKAQKTFAFPKTERLSGKKKIEELFKNGSSLYNHPLRIKFLQDDTLEVNQFMVSVPRKYIKKAVGRNRLKRRLKEAYRLYKPTFYQSTPSRYLIAIMYLSSEELSYKVLETKLRQMLRRLSKSK